MANLVSRLRNDVALKDTDLVIDEDKIPGGPNEGWPAWSERQVLQADHVLIVCTSNDDATEPQRGARRTC